VSLPAYTQSYRSDLKWLRWEEVSSLVLSHVLKQLSGVAEMLFFTDEVAGMIIFEISTKAIFPVFLMFSLLTHFNRTCSLHAIPEK
jgi:hypothetical protein